MSDLDPTLSDAPRLDQQVPELQQIGPYRVLELLGSGGFGEVYKAERRQPMRQTVAIKVIKLGFDTREIIARFNSERQALARMDHPNVAKVLDAGTTDTGRPYFVMEYVPGEPITQFCDAKKLSIKDRLELFQQACEAINHAHTKAIIHRDIKAGNVLAFLHDSKPTVKVIDFGIAKALTGDKLTEQTFNTERGQVIGTYETMSPEQADGSPDIDTRTDVYSLGVLLYELLSGTKPFDSETLRKAADVEMRRIIREVEPPRPSTRLSGMGEEATKIASARREDLSALSRRLHNELEWIPLKAIRKERDRRYTSPLQLSEDINNYLKGKPLLAGPESKVYRTKKFLRRHRTGAIASATMLLVLIAGVSFYIHSIRAEQRKTEAALTEAKNQTVITQAVSEFLHDVLAMASPERLGRTATTFQLLDAASKELAQGRLRDRPRVRAAVLAALGSAFADLGETLRSAPLYKEAYEIRLRESGELNLEVADSQVQYGEALDSLGKHQEAERLYRSALKTQSKLLEPGSLAEATTLTDLGYALEHAGNFRDCEPLFLKALEIRRHVQGNSHPETARALLFLGGLYANNGRFDQAEALVGEATKIYRAANGSDDRGAAGALNLMAFILNVQRRYTEAEPLAREALSLKLKILGPDHADVATSRAHLAVSLHGLMRFPEAEALLRQSLRIRELTLGDDSPTTNWTRDFLAKVLMKRERFSDAEQMLREALAKRHANPATQTAATLVDLLDQTNRHAEATTLREEYGLPDPTTQPTSGPSTLPAR